MSGDNYPCGDISPLLFLFVQIGGSQVSSVPTCLNQTQTTFCCCYGDGCNSAPALGKIRQLWMALAGICSLLVGTKLAPKL